MLTNDQMHEGRFYQWHKARRTVKAIKGHLAQGHEVIISTYTKATRYDRRHIEMFKACRNGAFVQHGRKWLCFDYCKITVRG